MRADLPLTRKAFARLLQCLEEEVPWKLRERYQKGFDREVNSLFDGGPLRYIFQRGGLSFFGAFTWGLDGYFISQKVHSLRTMTPMFVYYGRSFVLIPICLIASVLMYLTIPEFAKEVAPGELFVIFMLHLSVSFYLPVREASWCSRDCRQIFLIDSQVEQLCEFDHYPGVPPHSCLIDNS